MDKITELEKEVNEFQEACREKNDRRDACLDYLEQILEFRNSIYDKYEAEDIDSIDNKLVEFIKLEFIKLEANKD